MPDANVEFLVLPYDAADGNSLVDLLIRELESGGWQVFRAAVAFVRNSGNFPELVAALKSFASRGGEISLTFGADLFGGDAPASDYGAVEKLVSGLDGYPQASVNLYHEAHRTFHPKVYVFGNEEVGCALVIVGSSNWSTGGLLNNIEANLAVRLNFALPDHRKFYDDIVSYFTNYWSEA
jgi:HKD family nuclease